jgi:phosphate transport system substrate-binding protein
LIMKKIATLAGLSLLALVANVAAEPPGSAKVDGGLPLYASPSELSGSLVIAGSDTMQPLMFKLISAFQQIHRNTKMTFEGGGTEKALMKFISDQSAIRRGDADYGPHQVSASVGLMASSRPLTSDEIADFRVRYGHAPTEIPIAMDAVVIYVNRQNPVQGLTLEQVDGIFGSQRKRGLQVDITSWGQLGLKGEWEGQPIHLYGRDKQSGTRTFFKRTALLEGELKATVTEEPGSASVILAVSRDPLAIGYVGTGFQTSMVKAVPLAEQVGKPFVAPGVESVANQTYPLGRPLYLYAKMDPKKDLEPIILEFLKFVNSRQGQMIVAKAGTYPLPATQVAKNLDILSGSARAALRGELAKK